MDCRDCSGGCDAANAGASVDVLPHYHQSPLSRALQSATEQRPGSHPNTLPLSYHNLPFVQVTSIEPAPTTRRKIGPSSLHVGFWGAHGIRGSCDLMEDGDHPLTDPGIVGSCYETLRKCLKKDEVGNNSSPQF